jgi:tetratricopeptide (TPR) repeat protein
MIDSRALWALVPVVMVACSSTPEHVDDPLRADPPITTADPAAAKGNPALDRGVAFMQNEKFADAIPHLKEALEKDPKSAEAAFYLGVATEQTGGDKAKVEELYKQALAFNPKLVDAAGNLAAIYLADPPRPDEAINALQKALSHAPGDPNLLSNLGYAYSLKKEGEKARNAYEQALANEKAMKPAEVAQLRFALGTVLYENKQAEAAVPHLLKAAAAMNDDAASLATIANMLGAGKAFDDCVRLLDRALTLKPNVPELLVRRGVCQHGLKKEKEATKDYEAAIKADPKYQQAHYYLGVSLLEQKNKPGGRNALKKAVALGKDTPVGKAAQDKLDKNR